MNKLSIRRHGNASKGGSPMPIVTALGTMVLYNYLKGSNSDALRQFNLDEEERRNIEALRNSADIDNLMGSPFINQQAARYAIEAGRHMAKESSIAGLATRALGAVNRAPNLLARGAQKATSPVVSRLPGVGKGGGWKGKALMGAGAVGAGMAGIGAGKKLYQFGSQPAGVKRQGAGPGLPRHVNQWGVPTM